MQLSHAAGNLINKCSMINLYSTPTQGFLSCHNVFQRTLQHLCRHFTKLAMTLYFDFKNMDYDKLRITLCPSAVERCMYTMQTGTQMTKLKGKKKGLVRFFYLDEHKSCIRWRPSRKQDKAKSEPLPHFSELILSH